MTDTAQLASYRRVNARALPFDLAVVGALGTALALTGGRVLGLCVYFGIASLSVLGVASMVSQTRKLAGTRPEERGKRSDDRALAKAQRSVGCLPILFFGALGSAALFRTLNDRWPIEPWIVALGGFAGHVVGVGVIAWCRKAHAGVSLPPSAAEQ